MLRTRLPPSGFIEPCLPSPAEHPPSGPGWIHEIKHDGFRLMARRDAAGVRLLTRNGHDWSSRFPLIVAAVLSMGAAARCCAFHRDTSPPRWKICTTASVLNNS
jgi:ATP-dependent DNA ligase